MQRPMGGRCFIGTYVHEGTALVRIGGDGPANITANISNVVASLRAPQRFAEDLLQRLSVILQNGDRGVASRLTGD